MRSPQTYLSFLVLALALNPSVSVADLRQLQVAAQQCSMAALNAYALATTETSEAIITAAIAKCRPEWNAVVDSLLPTLEPGSYEAFKNAVRKGTEVSTGSEAMDRARLHFKAIDTANNIVERQFRGDAATAVFDARVAASNKGCGTPK
jgi:hypothetical protein